MTPWTVLDRAHMPDGTRLELLSRGEHFSIRVNGELLMNSRVHDSEQALAELALAALARDPARDPVQLLIGGLGFGYTLAAALGRLGARARVHVVEIAAAVVRWNRERLAALNGQALLDPRVTLVEADVVDVIRGAEQQYDAILLDVDNGPRAVGRPSNAWLYMPDGLTAVRDALAPGGVLAVWSAGPEPGFSDRLRAVGLEVSLHRTQSHRARTRERHFIWLGRR